MTQETPAERLGRAIRTRREELGLTQGELAIKAGVGPASIYELESGRGKWKNPTSLPNVERALGWARGSGARIKKGQEAIPLASEVPEAPAELVAATHAVGGTLRRLDEHLPDLVRLGIQDVIVGSAADANVKLDAAYIKDLEQRIMAVLRRHHLLPETDADDQGD